MVVATHNVILLLWIKPLKMKALAVATGSRGEELVGMGCVVLEWKLHFLSTDHCDTETHGVGCLIQSAAMLSGRSSRSLLQNWASQRPFHHQLRNQMYWKKSRHVLVYDKYSWYSNLYKIFHAKILKPWSNNEVWTKQKENNSLLIRHALPLLKKSFSIRRNWWNITCLKS